MKQAAAALLGAGLTAAGCYATGALLLDRIGAPLRRGERFPLALVLGAACLHLALFAVFAAQLAYWPVLVLVLLAPVVLTARRGAWRDRGMPLNPMSRPLKVLIGLVAGAYFTVYFFNAWAPEYSPDGSSYHLGIIARYLHHRGFEVITTNLYAMLGQGIEMLFAPAFAIGRHSAGALVHLTFAVALALMMLAYGRRLGYPWVGAAGALFTFLSPVVGKTASIAYIDVGAAAVAFGVFYWLELWDDVRQARLLVPAGVLAGYAYAVKYTLFTIGVYALLFVAWRARRFRPVLLVAFCAAVMAGPWIARNWIFLDNPLAPFANSVFRNPYVHVMFEKEYKEYLRHYEVKDLRTLPLEVTVGGLNTGGLTGPLFLLTPLALASLRYRAGRRLLLAGAVLLSTYPANVGTRFLIPCLPFFSLALALAFRNWPPVLAGLVLLHAASCWPAIIPRYANPYAWRIDKLPYREALRLVSPDDFLNKVHPPYGIARMIEGNVPEGEAVLTMNGIAESYTRREIRVGFQSASNEVLRDILNMGWDLGAQPFRARLFRFTEQPLRRIRVLQTARGAPADMWNVHELRVYRGGNELARAPQWRLRAWPNPWDVQLAFDNSPATRWRSWETPWPGMYLEVDFGREERIDQVRIETSPDSPSVRLELQALNSAGQWQTIAPEPEDIDVAPPPLMRRAATYELNARGIHYIALYDTDFGADHIRQDPDSWALREVARGFGARLYKTTW